MLAAFFKIIDGLSWVASRLADLAVVLLVCSMVYEVIARYLFNAPTVWAFDIAYMSNGAIFLFGIAWVLRQDGHIRIDVVRSRLPDRLASWFEAAVYLLLLLPLFGILSKIAIFRTIKAWNSGEVEMVSPWAPIMWPFYLTFAIGLTILSLQFLAQGLRAICERKTVAAEVHA